MNVIFTVIESNTNKPGAKASYKTYEISIKKAIREALSKYDSDLSGIEINIEINLVDKKTSINKYNIPSDKLLIINRAISELLS